MVLKRFLFLSTISFCVLFSQPSYSQWYYDSGGHDKTYGLQYDSTHHNLFFHAYQSDGVLDTTVIRSRIDLDSKLAVSGIRVFNPIPYGFGSNGKIEPLDKISSGFINFYYDQTRAYSGQPATKLEIVRYNDSSITHQIPLGPSAPVYNMTILMEKRIGDTLHFMLGWRDTLNLKSKTVYLKYAIHQHTITADTLPRLSYILNGDSLPVFLGGREAIKLPNQDWIIQGVIEDTAKGTLYYNFFQVSPDFKTIHKRWPRNYGLGSSYQLYREGNNIYFVNSSYRNYQGQPRQDYSIETFDYTTDTLPDRYFFELRDSTGHLDDFLGGSYFDGKHFVLSGLSDYLPPFVDYKYAIELLTVDLNFKIVNRFSYTDSSANFYPVMGSVLPHPKDSNKVIYSGYVIEPTRSSTRDLIWGEYNIINNVSLPEGPVFRKARIHLFPNPSAGEVQLVYPSADFKPYDIEVYNVEGKVVHRQTIASPRHTIHLNLPPGTYTLYHTNGDHYEYHPLIIR